MAFVNMIWLFYEYGIEIYDAKQSIYIDCKSDKITL